MTRKAFCERHQIPLTRFASWERAERKLGKQRVLAVEIQGAIAEGTESWHGFALNLANGRRIECNWQFVDAELMRLIRAAESA
jgi:hypothetical protein